MLNVKVRAGAVRFSIPVPYVLLNIGIAVISSELINRLVNKWVKESMKEKEQTFTMPPLNKQELKCIVSELKKHKGLGLVNVKAKDGTEVVIKL
ncbi:hypothetical protein I2483_06245 [Sporosarcina sp. E16_3]|uniref:hypothetical protein n=1 Tax=Sporosarcina sp. E16_3 TaxID=2789293 RepID=UPI001A92863B|nr:hypothetical protein [Sporosarcina sp. E16_3]MBO0601255.1 hypothetical protein [Sporosarcina sp. E16_3]